MQPLLSGTMPKPIKPLAKLLSEISGSTRPAGTVDKFLEGVWPIVECAFTMRNEQFFRITVTMITERENQDNATYSFTPADLEASFVEGGYTTQVTGPANNKVLRISNPL